MFKAIRGKPRFSGPMKYKILIFSTLMACSMVARPAEYRSPFTYSDSDPRIKHHLVKSAKTGISYPVHIFLPQGYSHENEKYPVIYATDGQWHADLFLSIKEKNIILVAIEQGPKNRRNIDYAEKAGDYFYFLTKELLPLVEDKYRIDSERRAILGASLGGVFVGYALLIDDINNPYFKVYASFDGAFGVAEKQFQKINKIRRDLSEEMNATVFLTGATKGNEKYVRRFNKMLEKSKYKELNIIRKTYRVKHEDISSPSFEEMIKVLYQEYSRE